MTAPGATTAPNSPSSSRSGLKFANGHDLTASDVKFSFDRINKINDENGPSSLLANIDSVEAKDDTTVVFHSKVKNDVTLKQVLSSPAGPIVDEESFDADKLADATPSSRTMPSPARTSSPPIR